MNVLFVIDKAILRNSIEIIVASFYVGKIMKVIKLLKHVMFCKKINKYSSKMFLTFFVIGCRTVNIKGKPGKVK